MAQKAYPKNDSIRNGGLVALYLFCLRKKWRRLARILGLVLACEIRCDVPERLFIPHPSGIVTGTRVQISNDVVLLQQVTLGCRSAYQGGVPDDGDPTIEEGVYVGPGAKILGWVTIGAWSIIGANAVVTASVPPHSIVVGHNKILPQTTK